MVPIVNGVVASLLRGFLGLLDLLWSFKSRAMRREGRASGIEVEEATNLAF